MEDEFAYKPPDDPERRAAENIHKAQGQFVQEKKREEREKRNLGVGSIIRDEMAIVATVAAMARGEGRYSYNEVAQWFREHSGEIIPFAYVLLYVAAMLERHHKEAQAEFGGLDKMQAAIEDLKKRHPDLIELIKSLMAS